METESLLPTSEREASSTTERDACHVDALMQCCGTVKNPQTVPTTKGHQ